MARNDVSFIFDLDGTLVDSVYQHVMAWQEALQAERDRSVACGAFIAASA